MEDAFFRYWGSMDEYFRACPVNIAATFSLESDPEHWITITNTLPMGFHGHEVWGSDFYVPLLKSAYADMIAQYPHL